MRKRIGVLLAAAAVAGAFGSSALADGSAHNCAGVATSSAAGPGLGQAVSFVAGLAPTAIPTLFDFANCGGNGFPP
jgi:hypothetical protein